MSIQSNLSVSPYFDDYDYQNDYYRVLFKPSTAVQVRELNQLQAILQRQIEEFGDVVLKRGTLLDGCQASFNPDLAFAKLSDVTVDGAATDVRSYINLFARGDNRSVIAHIVNAVDGFEAQDPDLKTIYLRYLNSGNDSNTGSFAPGETLTIYNNDYRLYDIRVNVSSANFTNADSVVITPAIEVQNTSGGTTASNTGGAGFFAANGDIVEDSVTGLKLQIIETVAGANADAITLRVKPVDARLANLEFTSWTVTEGATLIAPGTNNEVVITRLLGSGASAAVETRRQGGSIDNIRLVRGGSDYIIEPHVSIASRTASTTNITTLNLTAENYKARVTIPDPVTNPGISELNPTIGVGYGMSVTEGKIYQKGHFLRVAAQNIIVNKYNNTQSDIAVGFETVETFANTAVDPTLNDNAAGFLNQNAPGADRLKLVPRLTVKTFAEAENESQFFPIYKFSEGVPYSQRTDVQFNKIADELARRTYEESGNYVLDPFEITTRSPIDITGSATSFSYVIDPGLAYINGYRVETLRNYAKDVSKASQTSTFTNTSLDLVYGNYIRVNEFAGLNRFTSGNLIDLYDAAEQAISVGVGSISVPGAKIGTARVRSIVHESGAQGSSAAIYRVYLFDIRMSAGRNFKNVRSIHSVDGVADLILEAGNAVLKETTRNSLLFSTNRPLDSLSNIEYKYRTSQEGLSVSASGRIEIAKDSGAVWPYSGELTSTEKNELIIIPEENIISSANLTGTITASGATVTGTSTQFTTQLSVGDHIVDAANSDLIAQVVAINSDTELTITPSGELDTAGSDIARIYPQNIPVPLALDSSANAFIDNNTLTIDLAFGSGSVETASVVYNQKVVNAPSVQKTVHREQYVKLDIDANTLKGPWCLGLPDVFRLRGVYEGSNTSGADVTSEFYIDHGQTENYYGLSYLYQREKSTYAITANTELLVEFDCFERNADGGLLSINSYNIDDAKTLSELTAASNNIINTLEIPELATKDRYYDLREVFDFRPTVKATANLVSDPTSGNLTTNPTESDPDDLFTASNIKFPIPEGDLFFDMTYYNGRQDTILLNASGAFEFMLGRVPSEINPNQFPLYRVTVPAYPSLPKNLSTSMEELYDTSLYSVGFPSQRKRRFTIQTESLRKQVQGYTMENISQLERRITILEYYANLSETENRVKELSIPSSIDSTIERFKFGFYVDNFSDYQFSNIENPEFKATIFEYVLQPASATYNIPLKVSDGSRGLIAGKRLVFPYNRKNLLSQTFATSGPKPKEIQPPRPVAPPWQRICQSVINRNQEWTRVDTANEYAAISDVNAWTGKVEENIFTLTSNTEATGQAIDFYFDFNFGQDRIVIEQARDPGFSSSVQIFNSKDQYGLIDVLSEEDKRYLINQQIEQPYYPYPARWDNPDYDDTFAEGGSAASFTLEVGMISYMGKFRLNYDISKGRYLKVTIQKTGPFFLYHMCYPGDAIVDPIYNTFGFADKFASDAPPPYGSGTVGSPVGPPSEEDNSAPPVEGQKPPAEESPPIAEPGPEDPADSNDDIEVEEGFAIDEPGNKRDEPDDVYTRPVDSRGPSLTPEPVIQAGVVGAGGDPTITINNNFDSIIEIVDLLNPRDTSNRIISATFNTQ